MHCIALVLAFAAFATAGRAAVFDPNCVRIDENGLCMSAKAVQFEWLTGLFLAFLALVFVWLCWEDIRDIRRLRRTK